jgi:hypothetical protein
MNSYMRLPIAWSRLVPEIAAASPAAACSVLYSAGGISQNQPLAPDLFLPRARDARGRFLKGNSGNPRGRPPGIRNPRRRVPDLRARPLSAPALSRLLARKPSLLRPLAAPLLPPPLAAVDPAARLGIDLATVRHLADALPVLAAAWSAAARGDITPAEAARLARRVRTRLRALRRQLRAQRRLLRAARRKTGYSSSRRSLPRRRPEAGPVARYDDLEPAKRRRTAGSALFRPLFFGSRIEQNQPLAPDLLARAGARDGLVPAPRQPLFPG